MSNTNILSRDLKILSSSSPESNRIRLSHHQGVVIWQTFTATCLSKPQLDNNLPPAPYSALPKSHRHYSPYEMHPISKSTWPRSPVLTLIKLTLKEIMEVLSSKLELQNQSVAHFYELCLSTNPLCIEH